MPTSGGPLFLKISITRGHGTGKNLLLNEGALTFGSAPGNDFRLKLETIAERAMTITKTLRGYELLGQPEAEIKVNQKLITESHLLHEGDMISIGPFEFKAGFVTPLRDGDGKILTPVQIPIDISVPKADTVIADDRVLPKEEIFSKIRGRVGQFINPRYFFFFAVAAIAFLFYQKFKPVSVVEVEPEVPMPVAPVKIVIEKPGAPRPAVSPVAAQPQPTVIIINAPQVSPSALSPTQVQARSQAPVPVASPTPKQIVVVLPGPTVPAATPTPRPQSSPPQPQQSQSQQNQPSAQPNASAPSKPASRLSCIEIETSVGRGVSHATDASDELKWKGRWTDLLKEKIDVLLAGPLADSAVSVAVYSIAGDWSRACVKPNDRSQECFSRVKETVSNKMWEFLSKSQDLPTLLRNPYQPIYTAVQTQMKTELQSMGEVSEAVREIFPRVKNEMQKWISLIPREAFKRDALKERIERMKFEAAVCSSAELGSSYLERENRVRWCFKPGVGPVGRLVREYEIAELMARSIDYCRGMRVLQSRYSDRIRQANQYPLFSVVQCLNSKRESLGFGFDLVRARALDGCSSQDKLNQPVSNWVASEIFAARLASDKALQLFSQQHRLEAVQLLLNRASSVSSGDLQSAALEATLLAQPKIRHALGCGGLSRRNYCRF